MLVALTLLCTIIILRTILLMKYVYHTKSLGVTIDHKLSWNEHIQRIVNKAIQVNAFLFQNLRHCPIKHQMYLLQEYGLINC